MATKGQAPELAKSSAEVNEKYCSCCLQAGLSVEAGKYCVECSSLLCEECLEYHKRFPPLRSHKIVDKSEAYCHQVRGDNLVECARHYGQPLNSFCKDHDEVCCEVCLAATHSHCVNVNKIKDLPKGTEEIDELMVVKQNFEMHQKIVKQEIDDRNKNIANLNKQKNDMLIEIGKREDEMIKTIKTLADKSREDVSTKYDKHVEAVKSDIKTLEKVASVMEKGLETLEKVNHGDSDKFIHIKNSEKNVADINYVVETLYDNWMQTDLSYKMNQTLFDQIMNAGSFGEVVEDTADDAEYEAKYSKQINIKLDDDTQCPEIMGICLTENDTIVVIDYHNKRLKRLNKEGIMIDFIDLPGSPASLCRTGLEEFAIALREEKRIQFVRVGKEISLTSSFETDQKCKGISCDLDGLYVSCCDGTGSPVINVYSKTGMLRRTYDKDETGARIFASPCQILQQPYSNTFFVSDYKIGLIAMNNKGQKLWTFSDESLRKAWGIVKLPGKKLLVSGIDSKNILQLDGNGKKINELIGASKGLSFPSVVFTRNSSTLLVGGKFNFIHEYAISRKQLLQE